MLFIINSLLELTISRAKRISALFITCGKPALCARGTGRICPQKLNRAEALFGSRRGSCTYFKLPSLRLLDQPGYPD
jgi:hypothetical protein